MNNVLPKIKNRELFIKLLKEYSLNKTTDDIYIFIKNFLIYNYQNNTRIVDEFNVYFKLLMSLTNIKTIELKTNNNLQLTTTEIELISLFKNLNNKLSNVLGINFNKNTNLYNIAKDIDIKYLKELIDNYGDKYMFVKSLVLNTQNNNYLDKIYVEKHIDLNLIINKNIDIINILFLNNSLFTISYLSIFLPMLFYKRYNNEIMTEVEISVLENINIEFLILNSLINTENDSIIELCLVQIDIINILNNLYHGIIFFDTKNLLSKTLINKNFIDLLNILFFKKYSDNSILINIYPSIKYEFINSYDIVNIKYEKQEYKNYININFNNAIVDETKLIKSKFTIPIAFNNCFKYYVYNNNYLHYEEITNIGNNLHIYIDRIKNIIKYNSINNSTNVDLEFNEDYLINNYDDFYSNINLNNYIYCNNLLINTFISNIYELKAFIYKNNNIDCHYLINYNKMIDKNLHFKYNANYKIPSFYNINYNDIRSDFKTYNSINQIINIFRLSKINVNNLHIDMNEITNIIIKMKSLTDLNKDENVILNYLEFINNAPDYVPVKIYEIYNSDLSNYSKTNSIINNFYIYSFHKFNYINNTKSLMLLSPNNSYLSQLKTFFTNINKKGYFFKFGKN